MTKNFTFLSASVVFSGLFLSGCDSLSNGAKDALPYEQRHPIKVEKEESSFEIPLNGPGFELSSQDRARVKAFAYRYMSKGEGKITVSVPKTGMNAGAARTAARKIAALLEETGLEAENIQLTAYDPIHDKSGVRIGFDEFVASTKSCENAWSKNLADASDNGNWLGLGCSTRNNIAAMIANPRDLEVMEPLGEGMAARRTDVIDKYVTGTTTGASRGAEETASSTE